MGLMDLIGELTGTASGGKQDSGFDLNTIMNVANTLMGGSEEATGSQTGHVNTNVLMQVLGGLTGEQQQTQQPQQQTQTAQQAQTMHGGLLTSILSALGSGDESTTGAAGGLINPQTLQTVMSMFTGNSGGSNTGGSGINIGQLISYILPLLTNNKNLQSNFANNPVQTIEQLIGVKLPNEEVAPVVDAVNKHLGTKTIVPTAPRSNTAPRQAPKKPAVKPAVRKPKQ